LLRLLAFFVASRERMDEYTARLNNDASCVWVMFFVL
jgi:hypothetical protein